MTKLSGTGLLKVSSLLVCIVFSKISVASNVIIPFAVDKLQDDFSAKIASGELQEITVANQKRHCKSKNITSNNQKHLYRTKPLISKR